MSYGRGKKEQLTQLLEESRQVTDAYYDRLSLILDKEGTLDADLIEAERYYLSQSIIDDFGKMRSIAER